MTTVTQNGSTVEEAIEKALQQLNVSRDEVEIEVLSEGRKGFLGFGVRQAEVKITVKEQPVPVEEVELSQKDEIETFTDVKENDVDVETVVEVQVDPIMNTEQYLTNIAKKMGIDDLKIVHELDGKYVHFQLESDKAALLIGKRGQTLNALQQLAQLITNQHTDQFKVVRLNVGDYRERREQSLANLADRMADRAVQTGRKVQLEPMPAYERKVIHHTLSNRLDIETYSEGSDPHRYLVIEPM
ncbi:RNA-binding cell elongation regulator Jag/EloR [Sporosarcina pasteurii]|uniref:RNA-binding protein KhpB n=1 Tax=Sporosarcina pasteurii TaxID=1474 RepID=A0A380CLT8_SPOPA|nr:RNA-binding cell elongation regulator Jag/EloR [Sporosarcina pasteurii]MDS9471833.1 RNA-binding cell elongation regulator Jag/EloR [Sporosarcina pasteurii]QBQ06572.1 protein jag [Sporosarcina pasteurii]SUJ22031.1 R3H domain [Sporosarcina pasteurii]